MAGGNFTIAAVASTVSAVVAFLATSWLSTAQLNVDEAELAMRYVEFSRGPEGAAPPSLDERAFVVRAMSSAGFGELAQQARREARDARMRHITEQQLDEPIHPSLNIGIPDLTVGQLQAMLSMVNVFETGKAEPSYATITRGAQIGLIYGYSQASVKEDALHALIADYNAAEGARYAAQFAPYMARLQAKDVGLGNDEAFIQLLRQAAQDPVMQAAQTRAVIAFFRRASAEARNHGLREPLSYAVIYDSFVQGAWQTVAARTTQDVGELSADNERAWMRAYAEHRRDWFLNHPIAVLHSAAFRPQAFLALMDADEWSLTPPIAIKIGPRDIVIDADTLKRTLLVRLNTDAVLADALKDAEGPGFFERAGLRIDALFGGRARPAH